VAIAGLGIAPTALWGCRVELKSGARASARRLAVGPAEIHALFSARRVAKPSSRAFAEHLANVLRE